MLETFRAVARTAASAVKEKDVAIREIMLVFASPWYLSQTAVLSFEDTKPKDVSEHFGELKKFLIEKEKALTNSVQGSSVVVMERQVVQTTLNGYKTANPYGKRATTMETAVLLSAVSASVLKALTSVLEESFHRMHISAHSFALAAFLPIRDLFAVEEQFLVVDVGAEVTDISLVRNDVLLETTSFPEGRYTVTRRVAAALRTTPPDARTRLDLYRGGKSEQGESTRIEKALVAAGEPWQRGLDTALGNLMREGTLPHSVFLTADADLGEWFRVLLMQSSGSTLTMTTDTFTVVLLTPEHFSAYLTLREGVVLDPFLALEALFARRLATAPVVD
jgi:hypothetical protein